MPVSSAETFLQVVEKSSLLSPEQLGSVRDQFKAETDAKAVARELIKDGKVTKWQALQLLAGRHALAMGEYILLDQIESKGAERSFLTKHAGTGQQGVLKTIPRDSVADDPDAVAQFVEKAEGEAAAAKTKVLCVHRPEKDDQRCYVVLAKSSVKITVAPNGTPAPSAAAESGAAPKGGPSADAGPAIRVGPGVGSATGAGSTAPAVGGFAIDTGPKRKRKKKGKAAPGKTQTAAPPAPAVAAAATASVADADDADIAEVIPKSPIGLIIAGSIGAGLLLVAGLVLTVIFIMSRGGDEPIAVAQTENGEAEEVAGGEAGADPSDPTVASGDAEFNPEIDPVISVVPQPDPVAAPDPVAPTIDTTDPGSEGAGTPATPATSDGPDPDPSSSEPATQEVASADPPAMKPVVEPAVGVPTGVPAADPAAPGTGTTVEVPGETEAAVDNDVAPAEVATKEPVKKQAPLPPNKAPFDELAATVALPDFETVGAEAKILGSVYIPEGSQCFINLRGGVSACKGAQAIKMRNAEHGLAPRDWDIAVLESEGGPETKIAHLSVNDQHQLVFAWQADAGAQPVAPYLKNCVFSFNCDGKGHETILREPAQAEGLKLDLTKSVSKGDWPLDLCPDPEKVKIEITDVQGAKFTVEPAAVMGAARAEAWLRIEDGGNLLSLKLETSIRRNLQLEATPYIRSSPDVQPQKFNPRMLQTYLTQATAGQQENAATVLFLQNQLKNRQVPEDQKRRVLQPRLALAEADQAKIVTLVENLQALQQVVERLSGNVQIKFRVFYDADSSQVELLKAGT